LARNGRDPDRDGAFVLFLFSWALRPRVLRVESVVDKIDIFAGIGPLER
jgi:hypothetical protein